MCATAGSPHFRSWRARKWALGVILGLALNGAHTGMAQEHPATEAINPCSRINNSLDRLACYDRQSGRTPTVTTLPATNSDWKARTETSKLTDDVNVFLQVRSKESIECGRLDDGPIYLSVRCLENTTSALFITQCHMTSSDYNDYGHVDIRLDDDKAFTLRMIESTNSKSLGLWRGNKAIPFIKRMFGKSKLIARMTPYGQSPITTEMNISGLETAIAPLRKACGW